MLWNGFIQRLWEIARAPSSSPHCCSDTTRYSTARLVYHHAKRRVNHERRDYRGSVDVFGVHCPETDGVYLVPVDAVGRNVGFLRVDPTKNGQSAGIRWASDYAIGAGLAQGQSHALVMRRRRFDSGTRLF